MPKGTLEIAGREAKLLLANSPPIIKNLDEVEFFYCLLVGSDVLANDSCCYLIQFSDQLWLVPEMTAGAIGLKAWIKELDEAFKGKVVQIDYLPKKWRTSFLLIPGIEAELQTLSIDELEAHKSKFTYLEDKTLEDVF